MSLEENNKLLNEAIDDYSILTNNQKKLLKIMVQIAVNDRVVASIDDLSKLTKTMRATVTAGIALLEKLEIIEVSKLTGVRFSSCTLNQEKLSDIIVHHQNKKSLL